jgi:imidazolonepropionase-like amidohydrolase
VLQESAALHVHVGDAAKRDEPLMTSRSGVHAVLRDHFARAKRLQEGLRTAPRDPAERQWLASVRGDAALQVLVRALEGKLPVVVHAQRQEDIAAVLRLQQEFQLRMIVAEGAEAHLLADQLAAQKVPVLLGPVRLRPDDFATRHATISAAGILHKAGVQVAIASSDSHNNRHLRWEAGYALEAGLPWQVALDAVTRLPAQLFGVQGPGQLRVGDLADLAVYDDDPLSLQGHIKLVLAGGELELAPRQP